MESLKRLSFVCEYAGELIDKAEAKKRLQEADKSGESNYLICLKEHSQGSFLCTFVDPRHVGNLGRFINHSCDPNLVMLPVRVNHSIPRLALFSRQDLEAGEELTFDYSGCSTFRAGPNQLSDEADGSNKSKQGNHEQIEDAPTGRSKRKREATPSNGKSPKLHDITASTGSPMSSSSASDSDEAFSS
ncbi:histone-lysine N-methyltransferase SETMAR [Elysia marginata]|uniref:Histone-lysine N-methyltransferase SETMAR n=1 Tax=Elysia marginata TaxID=1093978 RepID=A0AAV4JFQ3_9GAST|nr:histone-lysine N-methyltransferase SETMAR [Elysia marginata]